MIQVLTPAATISLNPNVEHYTEGAQIFQFTPGETTTINAISGGTPGRLYVIQFITVGTTSYTTTFGTNFKSTGTLASGTTAAKQFTVTFVSDGINLVEIGRTAAM